MDFRSGSPGESSGAEEMEVSLAKPKHRVVSPSPAPSQAPSGLPFLSHLWQHHVALLVLMMQVELALQSVGLPGEPPHLPPTLSPDTW